MRTCRIAILACGCLALTSGLGEQWKVQGAPQSSGSASAVRPATTDPKGKKAGFKVVSMGEMETESGLRLGFTNFKASDGVGLWVFYLAKDDQAHAVEAFNQELARAVKVVGRSEKKNVDGIVVGERAEILAPSTKSASPSHAVIWTDGPTFHEIGSSSLQYVLELEKEYQH